jgi:hypothetical protein
LAPGHEQKVRSHDFANVGQLAAASDFGWRGDPSESNKENARSSTPTTATMDFAGRLQKALWCRFCQSVSAERVSGKNFYVGPRGEVKMH